MSPASSLPTSQAPGRARAAHPRPVRRLGRALQAPAAAAQAGMAIISAIFILLVLAVLGAYAMQMATMQHMGSAQDVESVRVYQAARAGIEWALYKVQPANGGHCAASTDLSLAGTSFDGIAVTVFCTGTSALYQIGAVACNQPTGGSCPNTTDFNSQYVERRIEVKLRTDLD